MSVDAINHACPVVEVSLRPFPGTDKLSIVDVSGVTVVVNTAEWVGVTRGVYVPPDAVVEGKRVKVRRFKGQDNINSMGMLLPWYGEATPLGTDVSCLLGITWHVAPVKTPGPMESAAPGLAVPKYDVLGIDSAKRHGLFDLKDGEIVYVTEKLDGENTRVVYHGGKFYVGSRNRWVAEGDNGFWTAVLQEPRVIDYCIDHPDHVVFGEKHGYGGGGKLRYDLPSGECRFRVFDVLRPDGTWVNAEELSNIDLPLVPQCFSGFWNEDEVRHIVGHKSHLASHHREGVVVTPATERVVAYERVKYKIVNPEFLR